MTNKHHRERAHVSSTAPHLRVIEREEARLSSIVGARIDEVIDERLVPIQTITLAILDALKSPPPPAKASSVNPIKTILRKHVQDRMYDRECASMATPVRKSIGEAIDRKMEFIPLFVRGDVLQSIQEALKFPS